MLYDKRMKLFSESNLSPFLIAVAFICVSASFATNYFHNNPPIKIINTKEAVEYVENFIQRKKKFSSKMYKVSLISILNTSNTIAAEDISGDCKVLAAAPLKKTRLFNEPHFSGDVWVCIFKGKQSYSVLAFINQNGEIDFRPGGHLLSTALKISPVPDVILNWPKEVVEQLDLVREAQKNGSKCIYY